MSGSLSFLDCWYAALHAPIGVVVQTNSPDRCVQKLYAARREAEDINLNFISIKRSPSNPNQLWLVKTKGQANGKAPVSE